MLSQMPLFPSADQVCNNRQTEVGFDPDIRLLDALCSGQWAGAKDCLYRVLQVSAKALRVCRKTLRIDYHSVIVICFAVK